ncbi:MAG: YegP family protein [Dehalococcoidia bacterium]
MAYEIWDLQTGNAVGDFDSEESALAEVRAMMQQYGAKPLMPWALERHDGDTIVPVAEGERLMMLALAVVEQATGATRQNSRPFRPKGGGKFEMYIDARGAYRWRFKAPNGQTIAVPGQGYPSKAAAADSIDAVITDAPQAVVIAA